MNGYQVIELFKNIESGKTALSNENLNQLFGFHDFSTDSIEWPDDPQWEDEEFGDLLNESFDFGNLKLGESIERGECVKCTCIHQIEQVISDEHGEDVEQIKFFIVAFQCDVVLVAVRGFAFETFQEDLFVYLTFNGDSWKAGTVVNSYLGEMSGDLKSDSDDDFFDD